MASRPVLFNSAMVRAVLSGAKTQTRRPCPPVEFLGGKGQENDPDSWGHFFDGKQGHGYTVLGRGHDWRNNHDLHSMPHPHGEAGDELWVRESFCPNYFDNGKHGFMADWSAAAADVCSQPKWTPSIHMKREQSRLALTVLETRVERLQDITEEEAEAEGFKGLECAGTWLCVPKDADLGAFEMFVEPDEEARQELAFFRKNNDFILSTAKREFRSTWESIYGKKPGLAWSLNPWVWVTRFELKAAVSP